MKETKPNSAPARGQRTKIMFKLNHNASTNFTHLQGYVKLNPAQVVTKFGAPRGESCDGKVSGEYTFESDEGQVFTLYEWKSTTLYDRELGCTPNQFWSLDAPVQLHVGGRVNADRFIQWLQGELGGKQ